MIIWNLRIIFNNVNKDKKNGWKNGFFSKLFVIFLIFIIDNERIKEKKDVQLAASVARLVYISNSTFLIYRGIICANRFVWIDLLRQ